MRVSFKKSISLPGLPIGNYLVMVLVALVFAIQFTYDSGQQYLNGMILECWSIEAIFGHMWLHTSVMHTVWNLITLWIFGRYVCLRIGNAAYPFAYVFAGMASAIVHIIYDGRPAIGASGAVMGVLGMHVVLCFGRLGRLGPWIILVWFLLNLTAGVIGSLPIAYLAHVGGFLGGIVLAGFLLCFRIVEREKTDAAPPSPGALSRRLPRLLLWQKRTA